MKLAVVADIHANVLALEAVLADLKSEAPDSVVNLGDSLSGPLWPEETGQILRDLNWPTVRGNHDRYLIDIPLADLRPTDSFSAERLSKESMDWLRTTKATLRLSEELFLCHGTPAHDDVYLMEKLDGQKSHLAGEDAILTGLAGEASPIVCCGHTHIPRLVRLARTGQMILNPGSVGLPAYDDDHPVHHLMEIGSPHARYSLMTKRDGQWSFEHKMLPYDWDKASREAEKNGRPDWARPLKHGFFDTLS